MIRLLPLEQSNLDPYYLQYLLPKEMKEEMTKVVTDERRVFIAQCVLIHVQWLAYALFGQIGYFIICVSCVFLWLIAVTYMNLKQLGIISHTYSFNGNLYSLFGYPFVGFWYLLHIL